MKQQSPFLLPHKSEEGVNEEMIPEAIVLNDEWLLNSTFLPKGINILGRLATEKWMSLLVQSVQDGWKVENFHFTSFFPSLSAR